MNSQANQSKTILIRETSEQIEIEYYDCSKQNETPDKVYEPPKHLRPECSEKRRAYHRERKARQKRNETPEQRKIRLAAMRKKYAHRIQTETPEQRAERQARRQFFYQKSKQKETLEQKEKCREVKAQKLINETPEEREKRLAKLRERNARRRQEIRMFEEKLEKRAHKPLSQCLTVENHNNSQISVKTENEVFEEEETQLTETAMNLDAWVVPEKFKTEIGETSVLDQKPILSEQIENKMLQSQLASSSLEAARDIQPDPSNLPIILINDEKETIIVDMKNRNL